MEHTMKQTELAKESVEETAKKKISKQDELLAALEGAMKRIDDLEAKLASQYMEKAATIDVAEERKRLRAEACERKRIEDSRMITGIFHNRENPGMEMEFYYQVNKVDGLKLYTLVDGRKETIPLGVAKYINSNLNYPVHERIADEMGNPVRILERKVVRAYFQSPELMDEGSLYGEPRPDLITIKTVF